MGPFAPIPGWRGKSLVLIGSMLANPFCSVQCSPQPLSHHFPRCSGFPFGSLALKESRFYLSFSGNLKTGRLPKGRCNIHVNVPLPVRARARGCVCVCVCVCCVVVSLCVCVCLCVCVLCVYVLPLPRSHTPPALNPPPAPASGPASCCRTYFWEELPVKNNAQLLISVDVVLAANLAGFKLVVMQKTQQGNSSLLVSVSSISSHPSFPLRLPTATLQQMPGLQWVSQPLGELAHKARHRKWHCWAHPEFGIVQKVFSPKGVPRIFDAFLTQF